MRILLTASYMCCSKQNECSTRCDCFTRNVGRTPGPRGSPWTRCWGMGCKPADEGVGCGPGGPPHIRNGPCESC